MPDVLVFGATGYTGKLTTQALARRGADFAIAGRDPEKLGQLARTAGGLEVRVVASGDASALAAALSDAKVLLTCVGPFVEHGWTAVQAAAEAGVHYLDSTGEGAFVGRLLREYDGAARSKGIAMAPAMGFDEVPADVAATLAVEGLDGPELVLTYALPSAGSVGTIKSALGIMTTRGPWIVKGRTIQVDPGSRERWAPMPDPLGPRRTASFPFAIGHLAPLHLDLSGLETYVTTGTAQRWGLRLGLPLLRAVRALPRGRVLTESFAGLVRRGEGPDDEARQGRWTILAEARAQERWRNVALQGGDVYGLTAELLAEGALKMAQPGYDRSGVLSPVQAFDVDFLEKLLLDNSTTIDIYGPGREGD